jgi:hypothetical protein
MSGHEAGDRSVVFDLDGTLYDHPVYDQAGARLIGLGRSAYWRAARGLLLDVGPFLAALECATGRQVLVFGKPERAIFDAVVDDVGVPAAEVAMVGDDIACDVDAARRLLTASRSLSQSRRREPAHRVEALAFQQPDRFLQLGLAQVPGMVARLAGVVLLQDRQRARIAQLAERPHRVVALGERVPLGLHQRHQRFYPVARKFPHGRRAHLAGTDLDPPAEGHEPHDGENEDAQREQRRPVAQPTGRGNEAR